MKTVTTPMTARELGTHVAVTLIIIAALFPGVLLRGEITPPGALLFETPPWNAHTPEGAGPPDNYLLTDLLAQHQPWYMLSQQALDAGEWPFWNPLELTGMPLLANYQSAIFFPLRILHAALPADVATTLFFLLRFFICSMTAYVCARGLGWRVDTARFFAVAYVLGGYFVTWAFWPLGDTAGWFPILFLGVEWTLDSQYRRGLGATALAGTLMLLAGHPESAFAMSAGLGLYFFLRLGFERRWAERLWRPIATMAAAWLVILLVCAAQLAPFLEYLPLSHTFSGRAEGEGFRTFIHPGGWAAFFVPRFFGFTADGNFWGFENSNFMSFIYPGMPVWAGIIALVWTRLRRDLIRIAALLVPSVLGAMMATNVPVVRPLLNLPVISSTVPAWHITFALFALPLLGAMGFERWFSEDRDKSNAMRLILGAAIPIVLVVILYGIYRGEIVERDLAYYVHRQLLMASVFLVFAVGAFCLWTLSQRRTWVAAIVVAVLAVDLFVAARGVYASSDRRWHFFETELTGYLANLGPTARVSAITLGLRPGLLQPYGIPQLWGYDGIYPGRILRLFEECRGETVWPRVEPICAVSHYLFPEGTHGKADVVGQYAYLTTMERVDVYANIRAMPRAYVAREFVAVPDDAALFDAMRSPNFDPYVALSAEAPRSARNLSVPSDGTVSIMDYGANEVRLESTTDNPAVVVLADAYYPGWNATIEGESAELFPIFHAFRGIVVPAGTHEVTMTYRPRSFYIGYAVSWCTLMVSAAVSLIVIVRRRSRRS